MHYEHIVFCVTSNHAWKLVLKPFGFTPSLAVSKNCCSLVPVYGCL